MAKRASASTNTKTSRSKKTAKRLKIKYERKLLKINRDKNKR